MKTVLRHIRDNLELPPTKKASLSELRKTEWSKEFETLMRNRLIMGSMRYNSFKEKIETDHGYRLIESAISRLNSYLDEGNTEHLIDAANLCMIEFESPSNPKAYWNPIDDGEHVSKR